MTPTFDLHDAKRGRRQHTDHPVFGREAVLHAGEHGQTDADVAGVALLVHVERYGHVAVQHVVVRLGDAAGRAVVRRRAAHHQAVAEVVVVVVRLLVTVRARVDRHRVHAQPVISNYT